MIKKVIKIIFYHELTWHMATHYILRGGVLCVTHVRACAHMFECVRACVRMCVRTCARVHVCAHVHA